MLMTAYQVLAVPTIKAAMLVFGIMEICIDSQADKNRTHHLKLEPVWDAAHRSVGRQHQAWLESAQAFQVF